MGQHLFNVHGHQRSHSRRPRNSPSLKNFLSARHTPLWYKTRLRLLPRGKRSGQRHGHAHIYCKTLQEQHTHTHICICSQRKNPFPPAKIYNLLMVTPNHHHMAHEGSIGETIICLFTYPTIYAGGGEGRPHVFV